MQPCSHAAGRTDIIIRFGETPSSLLSCPVLRITITRGFMNGSATPGDNLEVSECGMLRDESSLEMVCRLQSYTIRAGLHRILAVLQEILS